ncbi:TonB-dependent siderophore receptor [Pseudomonas protegens]|uniref:TonB-dependent siderophore receptor n=1 Tax=Pseudomonas protegens TaxID=380021 RepID=UPI0022642770|nr:TonB-dependent receptor [Pseudomonas protegens]
MSHRSRFTQAALRRSFNRTALSITLGTLLAATCVAPFALAQEAVGEAQEFNIAPGALGTALSEFAAASGVTLSFGSSQTQGLVTQGLKGHYSFSQGVAQLLAGSGLQLRQEGPARYTLVKLPTGAALHLGPTQITGASLGTTTEDTGSYTTGAMQTATKLALSIRETPQSVTVVTRQRMDDQNMQSLEDVLKSTPGISITKDGPQRPIFYSRGFAVQNLMVDGLANDMSHYLSRDMSTSADTAIFDRVEVMRGAAGLMQGTGSPSAAINMVRKRPTAAPRLSITASAGSWDNYRSEIDASSALNDSGTLRGRLVTAYQSKNSFQDVADAERSVFYGIAEADLNDNTTLTVGATNQASHNTTTWGGLPAAIDGRHLHLSRSAYLGSDWEYWDQNNVTAFGRLEYRFDNGWKLLLSASKSWSDLQMLGSMTERFGTDFDEFGQYVGQYHYKDQQDSYDLFASGPFALFGREHELVVGASQRELAFRGKGNFQDNETRTNIYRPDPHSVPKPQMDLDYWRQERNSELKSFYLTSRFSLAEPLTLILGGRLDWYDYDVDTRFAGVRTASSTDYKVTRNLTRYAGMVYDLDAHHSVYASYTDVFSPQAEVDSSGGLLKPVVGKNYETGIKGEYFEGALTASAAVFRIDQVNRAKQVVSAQCSSLQCYEASGEVRSEGIELEVNGELAPGWELGAGYTYAQAKYRKDGNEDNVGRLFDTDIPRHVFKAFTTYQLPGDLHRWTVGGGLYSQNRIYNKDVNFYDSGTPMYVEQKGYALVDLMTRYRASEHLEFRLNLNNVFDKKYYQSISTNTYYGNDIYGEPRNAMVTVRWSL